MADSKVKITLDVSEVLNELDIAIEKANQLVRTLNEAKEQADSLSNKET